MTSLDNTKYLKNYTAPDYLIPTTDLYFDIFEKSVTVTAILQIKANSNTPAGHTLKLNGERLKLTLVEIDGEVVSEDDFVVTDKLLCITNVPSEFTLKTVVEIDPYNNTWLEGLYKSGNVLCTQNESQGFRKITYYIDRPDVMSAFTTTITADKTKFPHLLSNGNKTESQDLPHSRHLTKWSDPFLKPCYLFALVAGDFAVAKDNFTTMSGRKIDIHIFVDHGNDDKVQHAITSLKKAMLWDEETFGLEYDLDLFMIVAVDAFNYGAMENKGLNIFNSACALANPETATDSDFSYIETVVAHEYFHNWTGDRVTCRDWFQITLKEGLTVFRDGEFTADMNSRPIKRIHDACGMRAVQFVEDAGPNSHPIQPQSYKEINNFYTATVYNKGAEVIRMLQTILGVDGFRKGIDKYFELYDGMAVTTEDFLHAMESANNTQLPQFRRWYNQAGTPICKTEGCYNQDKQTYTLTVKQSCPATADNSPKEPFYIPMTIGLIDKHGKDLLLQLENEDAKCATTNRTLIISESTSKFVFTNINSEPTPSLFRNFSAPVKSTYSYSRDELIFLLKHDSDSFNRYDAGQQLAMESILEMITELKQGNSPSVPEEIITAFGTLISDETLDRAFCSEALTLPPVSLINQELEVCDFHNAFTARNIFIKQIAEQHKELLKKFYNKYSTTEYKTDGKSIGEREFKNLCLSYLSALDDKAVELAKTQFINANNMTDKLSAMAVLCKTKSPERDSALKEFHTYYKEEFNVINKWFAVQASASSRPDAYGDTLKLAKDELFDNKNPNRLRSLYGAFANNSIHFHHASGQGYKLIADICIEVDKFNNLTSAGFAKAFKDYPKLNPDAKKLMKQELTRIVQTADISTGLKEIVENTLKSSEQIKTVNN